MQLQPPSTRQDSVEEKPLHLSVPKVGSRARFGAGLHSCAAIRVHPAKLPTLLRAQQKPPARARQRQCQRRAAAAMGHGQPRRALGHRRRRALRGDRAQGCPGQRAPALSSLPPTPGLGQPLPPGRDRARRPGFGSYHSAVLGLSPVPRGRGVRTAAAPRSALTGREGVEGGAGAGGQSRVRAVQQAFPALLLQALVHPLQL